MRYYYFAQEIDMETTQTIPDYPRGITFEQVWAGLMENREGLKELREVQNETAMQIKETNKKMGDLYKRFGEMAEHLVKPNIHERFNELGYHFSFSSDTAKIKDERGIILAEFDTYLEDKDYIIAIEIKTKPDLDDIDDHLKRLQILREARDNINDHRKIHGGIAGAIFNSDVKRKTIKAGLFVIEQSGDTMKITVPQGFVPREW